MIITIIMNTMGQQLLWKKTKLSPQGSCKRLNSTSTQPNLHLSLPAILPHPTSQNDDDHHNYDDDDADDDCWKEVFLRQGLLGTVYGRIIKPWPDTRTVCRADPLSDCDYTSLLHHTQQLELSINM